MLARWCVAGSSRILQMVFREMLKYCLVVLRATLVFSMLLGPALQIPVFYQAILGISLNLFLLL